mgnify:CR=1 FL=1
MVMTHKNINLPVIVTAIGFRKNLVAYPRRIEFNGDTYNLNEILAKAEYSNDSQSIQDILNVIK